MKKFNKNSLLFIFVVTFIIAGIWGNCFEQLKWKTIDMLAGLKHGNLYSVFDFKFNIDDVSNNELSYHDTLMNVNSVKENALGTRVIEKEDTLVVKSDSGSLIGQSKKLDINEIKNVVKRIDTLKTVAENNGANFLYCAAPTKELYEISPQNVENHSKENYDLFLSELANSNIPTINFADTINNKTDYEPFYYTDHHWTAKSGFAANNALINELNARYGFEYNKELMVFSNYSIDHYQNWFLGSKGKKVGTYFTWSGADDFDLITPKFETNLTEEQPFKNQIRTGEFKDTVLYMENMEKDYYKINTYATYSGGDFRLQIMKNNLNPQGKKILLIRDSFACVVAPFLALQTSELHICDMRDYEYYVGEKLNAEKYIKEIQPDYVIVLYSGISTVDKSDGRYDFF